MSEQSIAVEKSRDQMTESVSSGAPQGKEIPVGSAASEQGEYAGKAAPFDPEDNRKPIEKVAENRAEDEEHYISSGSANFMTWLGVTLMIPGIVMLVIPSVFNLWGGIGFCVLGAYVAWTGFGAVKLFK